MKRTLCKMAAIVACLSPLLATGCEKTASVAVRSANNHVFYSEESTFHFDCDQNAKPDGDSAPCTAVQLGFKPVAAAFAEDELVVISNTALYRCGTNGSNRCAVAVGLTFNDAVGVGGGSSGRVWVISRTGKLDFCDGTKCDEQK